MTGSRPATFEELAPELEERIRAFGGLEDSIHRQNLSAFDEGSKELVNSLSVPLLGTEESCRCERPLNG
jgi:hypothetical protein